MDILNTGSSAEESSKNCNKEPGVQLPSHIAGRVWKVFREFVKTPICTIAVVLAVLIISTSILANVLSPFNPLVQDGYSMLKSPSVVHWLGTDGFGRDILSRLLYGGRISLIVGASGSLAALLFGVPLGIFAGYYGGRIDYIIMRLIDALMAFPPILLALSLNAILGPTMIGVILAVSIAYVPLFATVSRGAVLSQREREYVLAAITVGMRQRRILVKHILPNILNPILIQLTNTFPMAIITEASLSFLGLGSSPDAPSWGRMLSEGYRFLMVAPLVSIFPLVAVCVTAWSFNTIGDRLAEMMDPKHRIFSKYVR